ncbi:MAG: F0F1 ATP synthase subunit epsilon [Holophagales bacterium]|jgi:F-type H+-transporting ATPase subunit epsilon|nr:F0F1 ATP synthase subunit epsilon [Holophagales bacterium]
MSGYLRLEVMTMEGKVFSSSVQELQFPSAHQGYYGILPDHTPVLTPLGDGHITCLLNGKKTTFAISGGFAEIGPNNTTILARECKTIDV